MFAANSPLPYQLDAVSLPAETPNDDTLADLVPSIQGTFQGIQSVEISPDESSPMMRQGNFETPRTIGRTPGSQPAYSPHGSDLTPFSFAGGTTQSPMYSPADKKEEDDKDDKDPDAPMDSGYSPGASIYSGAKSAYTMASGRYTAAYTPKSGVYAKSVMYTPSVGMSPYSPFSRKSPGYTPMSSQYGAATPTAVRTPTIGAGTPGSGYSPSIAPASVAPSTSRSVEGGSPIIEDQQHAGPVQSPGYGAGRSPEYTPVDAEDAVSQAAPSAVYSASTLTNVRTEDDVFEHPDDEDATAAYRAPEAEE